MKTAVIAALGLCVGVSMAFQALPRAPAAGERHLRNIRQLTSGGENAEAYFSPDGTRLIFQSTRDGYPCDQIYTMKIDGSDVRRVSTGKGRTTCGYFYPGAKEKPRTATSGYDAEATIAPDGLIAFTSVRDGDMEIYTMKGDGSGVRRLTTSPGPDGGPFFSWEIGRASCRG